jgi:hypothetical protein
MRLKLTAKIFIGLGIVIVLWGVIDSWLLNQRHPGIELGNRNTILFILGPLTALTLFGIHWLILKTKIMLREDSHTSDIFADLLPWFVWVAVGLATWGVNEWFFSRPLSMTSPWDWMSSLVVVGCYGWLGWVCINLFSASYSALYVFLNWLRTSQPPYLALISVGIATGLVCGFIGGVVGTVYMLSVSLPRNSMLLDIGPPFGIMGAFFLRCFISESSALRKLFVRNIWIVYSLWVVMLSSVFLGLLPILSPFYFGGWDTTWIWSAPITGASLGLLGVLIFFLEQSVGDIGLKNQDNARWLSRQSWWYRRRLTEWNPFWFTALVVIPLLSIFLMSVPAVKDLQMIQQVFAEEGSEEYMSRMKLLDPACMALKQFELEIEQSPDWKKMNELEAKANILFNHVTPMTEGQLLLYEALQKEIFEIMSKNSELWSGKRRQLMQLFPPYEDGPLFKQMEQKKSDHQAATDAAFSKLMAYIWNQCSLGLGVGLVVDVMLLVGVAAWLNIRRSSKFPSSTQ